jgi:hypothetical protein
MTDTPVTKLDSVERLTEKYCTPKITVYGVRTYATREQLAAALAEMWDLSQRTSGSKENSGGGDEGQSQTTVGTRNHPKEMVRSEANQPFGNG